MIEKEEIPVGSKKRDDRIDSDGKITERHGNHLKAKAIHNITKSLIKRADDLGSGNRNIDSVTFNTARSNMDDGSSSFGKTRVGTLITKSREGYFIKTVESGTRDYNKYRAKRTDVAIKVATDAYDGNDSTYTRVTLPQDEIRSWSTAYESDARDYTFNNPTKIYGKEDEQPVSNSVQSAIEGLKEQRRVLADAAQHAKRLMEGESSRQA